MSIDPHTAAAISELDRAIKKGQSSVRAYRAEGRGMANGRAIIRRVGEVSDDDETYAVLVPAAPTPGYDSAMLIVDGKEVHAGVISQGGDNDYVTGIGMTVAHGNSQANANNPSTSNNYPGNAPVEAMALVWAESNDFPDGTYDFLVTGSFLGGHTANDSIMFLLDVDGTESSPGDTDVVSGVGGTRVEITRRFASVVVTNGCTFSIKYARFDGLVGETATADNPAIQVIATRKM